MDRQTPTYDDPRTYLIDPLPIRRLWRAVPRDKQSDLDSPTIRLHTVQALEAYEQLASTGILTADATRVGELPGQRHCYSWMDAQMTARGLPGNGMLWLWARIARGDLVNLARMNRGSVLLTVEVPADRVLLSDFIEWHCVLNGDLMIPNVPGETEAEWERRWEAAHEDWDKRIQGLRTGNLNTLDLDYWPAGLRAELEASWEAIFERDAWHVPWQVQGTVREIRAADVVREVEIGRRWARSSNSGSRVWFDGGRSEKRKP